LTFDETAIERYAEHYFKVHPKAKKKPIEHPYHPSINQWMIMKRPAMNAMKQKWKDFMVWLVEDQGYSNLRIERCDVEVMTYYYTNRRHDPDNSVPKFVLDGICDSGMLVDDDSKHIERLILRCGVDPANPRTEIKLIVKEQLNNG